MKQMQVTVLMAGLLGGNLCLAQGTSTDIRFRGEILDGPLVGQSVAGSCERDPRGDPFKQRTTCRIRINNADEALTMVDHQTSLQVVGGERSLRIIIGPSLEPTDPKGNFKIAFFEALTHYDDPITLFDLPPQFAPADLRVAGISDSGSDPSTSIQSGDSIPISG